RMLSGASSAAIKSPIARNAPPTLSIPRFPPLQVFRRRPPQYAAISGQRPASENLHRSGHYERGIGEDLPPHPLSEAAASLLLAPVSVRCLLEGAGPALNGL